MLLELRWQYCRNRDLQVVSEEYPSTWIPEIQVITDTESLFHEQGGIVGLEICQAAEPVEVGGVVTDRRIKAEHWFRNGRRNGFGLSLRFGKQSNLPARLSSHLIAQFGTTPNRS